MLRSWACPEHGWSGGVSARAAACRQAGARLGQAAAAARAGARTRPACGTSGRERARMPWLAGVVAGTLLRRRSRRRRRTAGASVCSGDRAPLRMVDSAAAADGPGRSGGVASGLKDINNTGESSAALWVGIERLLRPIFRLVGGKRNLWPPSRQSAPLLALAWCLLCTPLWFLLRERRNRDVEVVEARRREYALSSLENLIANERVRLEEEEKVKVEAKEKKVDADPEEGDSDDDTKIPPPAEKLFELLYDEIEHRDITHIGVDKNDERFTRGMELLRIHTAREIREAIDKTKQARDLKADFSMLNGAANLPKDLHHFRDGEKMQKRTRFAKTQVRRYMRAGVSASDEFSKERIQELDALIKEATEYSKVIGSENRRAMRLIWGLLRPFYKHILAGTFIKFCGETMGIVWWTNLMQLPYIANRPGTFDEVMAFALKQCTMSFVWWLFENPCHHVGDSLRDHARNHFTLYLRDSVMNSILRQDREYFDFHQAGVLQERLNHDTYLVSEHLIQQPAEFVIKVLKVLVRLSVMYAMSPKLFFISMSLPVPMSILMSWIGVDRVRKLDQKISKVNDLAAAGTIDVLKEMTTVRQFAMEAKEGEKYGVTNIFRRILEQRLDTVKRLTWQSIDVFFVGMHVFVVYFGIQECLRGLMMPATVFNFTVYNWEISWEVRYILSDLIPQMTRMVEPLERLSAVLGSTPRIEPHPQKILEKPLLKPAKFRGHIVFKDCHFRYPTERQKPVLCGISFEVKPGEKVAFVGKTGCGKSTSVNLLQRLYEVDTGSVTIDGEPISRYDVHHLRRNIGIVSQDNVLFSTSIKENIIYGMGQGHLPMPTDEEIWKICDKANATEFIKSFPNKLYTNFG